ncbi:unnamed protein product [Absidia cylindrospora]
MLSVKLKLYEIMDRYDKFNLLFWSGNNKSSNVGMVLPTFATSTLSSEAPTPCDKDSPSNVDFSSSSTMMLHQITTIFSSKMTKQGSDLDYIYLKPYEYYRLAPKGSVFTRPYAKLYGTDDTKVLAEKIPLYEQAQIIDRHHADMHVEDQVNVVVIPSIETSYLSLHISPKHQADYCIFLIGNPVKNKWILDHRRYSFDTTQLDKWIYHYTDEYSAGFNIY